MKARRSNRKITPHGGAIPVLKQMKDFGLPRLIRDCLGTRVKQAKYSNEDVIIAWMLTNFCGGARLDHITKLRKSLSIIPGLKLPSNCTLSRVMRKMATEIVAKETVSRGRIKSKKQQKRLGRKTYKKITRKETNENDPLNKLLVKSAKKMGLLNSRVKYVLDMDATFVPTECKTATKWKTKRAGHHPMVSTIGKLPVYISMRNGNVAPGAQIQECLERAINGLNNENINVGKVRMDAGGYCSDAFDYLNDRGIKFYSGIKSSKIIREHIAAIENWEPAELKTTKYELECEAASFEYKIAKSSKTYKYAVIRVHKKHYYDYPKKGWTFVPNDDYNYKIIVTNDYSSSIQELITFYNQRGASERVFDDLKNNFAWRNCPFSNMNENTVFLLITALTCNVYQAILRKFKKTIKQLRLDARLRDFIFVFMTVACEVKRGIYVFYDTDIAYEKIC